MDAADWQGNAALHWAANNGHSDCVSFLVNFGANLWSLNNEYQTARDVAGVRDRRLLVDLLDGSMARQSALNPKSVRKMKEKALREAEARIRACEKRQQKAAKKAEKEEKELAKKRRKLLSLPARTAAAAAATAPRTPLSATTASAPLPPSSTWSSSPSSSTSTSPRDPQTSSLAGISGTKPVHLFESKAAPKASVLRFSDLVNASCSRSAPKASSLGAVSRKILHKKFSVSSHSSMNNLSNLPASEAGSFLISDFHVRHKLNPDSGYFSKSSVRSLSGLRRDSDILFGAQ